MVSLDHPHGDEWMRKTGLDAATHVAPCPGCGVPCRWTYEWLRVGGPFGDRSALTIHCMNTQCPTNTQGDK